MHGCRTTWAQQEAGSAGDLRPRPFETSLATNGAQPDWYLGWLIGGLRLMPGFDVTIGHYTLVPNPFWGGALFPMIVFGILFAWPALERRVTGDHGFHNLLDRPRDVPWRTGVGAAVFTWVSLVFLAGASDRVFVSFGVSYPAQIWFFRAASFALLVVVFLLVKRYCEELLEEEAKPPLPQATRAAAE